MAKRPNMSPSGWISNLSNQPRQGKSLENRQQAWIKAHMWLVRANQTVKITQREFDEAQELGVLQLLDQSNRTVRKA